MRASPLQRLRINDGSAQPADWRANQLGLPAWASGTLALQSINPTVLFEGLFHDLEGLADHFADVAGSFVRHEIRYPDNSRTVVPLHEYLYGGIVMRERSAAHRPNMSICLIVNAHD